ncbi:sensor histidine kinase [Thermoflavimicrobium daqui]|jgi:signal transduction histidine kinase|uniref:histidine kinase n=1 Tax=Thermoflavimicrobium daqui TaxID=2137476 RepID=A0A364K2C5_9BACL|nr:ATP-binding protein [Thermoflavimicrobium daqui]RAL22553.1 hypothetical protein DL897_14165 [Thermoflavimicrobium daqui]
MMKGLHFRLSLILIGIVTGVILLATLVLMLETHYHFLLYKEQVSVMDSQMEGLNQHFEMALIQAILWTALGSVILAISVSFYMAKRITAPLVEMRKATEEMIRGNLQKRVHVKGNDEIADLGKAFNHLTKRLEQQELLRKNLTADVAHELRTPLTTLKSYMEAFADGIWEPTFERIHSCYEEIERLIRLVDDLHQLTRLESPEFQLNPIYEDLSSIVGRSAKAILPAYIQKGVQLVVKADHPIWMEVDPERMTQVIINLLSNALKFTPAFGTVTVKTEEANSSIQLVVIDTGMGIPKSDIEKIFERFYRVEKSRNRRLGGAGIGLTIVKKLVEAHQGKIEVESEVNQGTTIRIQFPK